MKLVPIVSWLESSRLIQYQNAVVARLPYFGIMSTQISAQASKLWQIVSAPSTAEIYQQALAVTVTILRETANLVWLVFCLVLVAFDWFWNNSIALGRKARAWVNRFDSADNSQKASQMGQEIMVAGRSSLDYLIAQAREQLGLPMKSEMNDAASSGISGSEVKTEAVNVTSVSPKEKEKVGEDEEVESNGSFIGTVGTEPSTPSLDDAMETNGSSIGTPGSKTSASSPAEMQAVVVKEVSPAEKTRPGEDEEVPMAPTKES